MEVHPHAELRQQQQQLPPEVIEQCLSFIGPLGSHQAALALVRCRAASRDLCQLASQNSLWRPHLSRWKHSAKVRLRLDQSSDTRDMQLFKIRSLDDQAALQVLNHLILSPTTRSQSFERLAEIGMNAWDVLCGASRQLDDLKQWRTFEQEEGPYWLTRRHWLRECLGYLARRDAMALLSKTAQSDHQEHGQPVDFEEALMVFSSFLGADRSDMRTQLDSLAEECRAHVAGALTARDLRETAKGIHRFMDQVGMSAASPHSFHDLENNFPHITLSQHRPTLPMTLVWLFCSLAQRLGVAASPVGFPSTVLAFVSGWAAPAQEDGPEQPVPFYYDLYRDVLHSRDGLADQLHTHGVPAALHQELLDAARPRDIVLRSARNIYNSIGIQAQGGRGDHALDRETLQFTAAYASSATLLCLSPIQPGADSGQLLTAIVSQRFQYDAGALHTELSKLAKHSAARSMSQVARSVVARDARGPVVKRRRPSFVKFGIGQVFRHAKYDYVGLIVGWHENCKASEDWQRAMGVTLENSTKPFYPSFVSEGDQRYVLQDNIVPLEEVSNDDVLTLIQAHPSIGFNFASIDAAAGRFRLSVDAQLEDQQWDSDQETTAENSL